MPIPDSSLIDSNNRIKNNLIGICNLTFHALMRFKEHLCKEDKTLFGKSDNYFITEFKKAFYSAKKGQIKNYHNVIRLINNDYKPSYYLFNHYYNIRFVVIETTNTIVTCEPIRAKKHDILDN